MSVDFLNAQGRALSFQNTTDHTRRLAASRSGPITNTVIIFTGWGGSQGGQPVRRGRGTADRLRQDVQRNTIPGFNRIQIGAWQASYTRASGMSGEIEQAFRYIVNHFDPRGKLIIYGYSLGGFNAMALTYSIYARLSFFEATTNRFARYIVSGVSDALWCRPRVDLLLTIDPARGPGSGSAQRRIFSAVRLNINYYQTHESRIYSRGGPTTAMVPELTEIRNFNWSSRYTGDQRQLAHGRLDEDTYSKALHAIRGVIGYEATPRVLPVGMEYV